MHTQDDVIQKVLEIALARCASHDLALLLEDAMRMHMLEALLDAGCKVRVGAHAKGTDRVLSRSIGQPTAWSTIKRSTRRGWTPATGRERNKMPDIYVEQPCAVIELKVFGEVGPKDYPDKPGCRSDLDKLVAGTVDAAIVAASASCYAQLQSSGSTYSFTKTYPAPAGIPLASFKTLTNLSWNSVPLVARAAKTAAPRERVIVVTVR